MDAREQPERLGPLLPDDSGLASLGLLMQLGAAIGLGTMVLFVATFAALDSALRPSSFYVVVALLGIVRSGFHFYCGRSFLYPSALKPLGALQTYAGAATIHTIALVMLMEPYVPFGALVGVLAVSAVWPATLMIVMTRQQFRRYESGVPVPDDSGFEGVSLVMLILGLAGALWAAMMFAYVVRRFPNDVLSSEIGAGFLVIHAALLARGIMQVVSGHAGAVGGTPTAINSAAARYYNVGLATAAAVGAILFVMSLDADETAHTLIHVVFVAYVLLAWPIVLRWFFGVRGLTTIGATDEEHPHRAPDRGLVSLGWLLLAVAVLTLAISIPRAVWAEAAYSAEFMTLGTLHGGDLAGMMDRSSWLSALLGALQLWAAIELIMMSERKRIAAAAYGAGGGALTIYIMIPFLEDWQGFFDILMLPGYAWDPAVVSFAQLGLALVLPLATLALVARRRAPQAQARFVTGEDSE